MPRSDDAGADDDAAQASSHRATDALIAGLHHAVNNRMAALGAVGQVLETDLAAEHPLAGAIAEELQRLESTAGLLRLLVQGDGPEPVQLELVVRDAAQLLQMHHELRDLSLDVEL